MHVDERRDPDSPRRSGRRSPRCACTLPPSATRGWPRSWTPPTRTTRLKARWHVAQVNADRLDMSDHSWVHLQIVLNRALHLFRLLPPPRREVRDGGHLRHARRRRRGGDRRRLPAARSRHVDPPHRPRGLQPLPRPAAPRPPAGGLRRARAHGDRERDRARDHRPPQRRPPAHARSRCRAGGGRAGHGARPLARRDRAAAEHARASRPRRSTRCASSTASAS